MSDEAHSLRASFDAEADAYDRSRPVLPDALFDDLLRLTGLQAGDQIVEVGCGTGQATVPLARRGVDVTAVELGPNLAAIARRNLKPFPHARVVTSAFEDWTPDAGPYDAVVSVNAWHWIPDDVGWAKAAALLRDGGHVAIAGCNWTRLDDDLARSAISEEMTAAGLTGPLPPHPDEVVASPLRGRALDHFEPVGTARHVFTTTFTLDGYLDNVRTQSPVQALGPPAVSVVLDRIRRRLEPETTFAATFVAVLRVGRKR